MGLFTYYIDNREYNHKEVIEYIDGDSLDKSFIRSTAIYLLFAGIGMLHESITPGSAMYDKSVTERIAPLFLTPLLGLITAYFVQDTLAPELTRDLKCSGIELVNFLNELSDLSYFSFSYKEKSAELITKLMNHQYANDSTLTIDDISWYSCPAAVLNAHKEDLPYHSALIDAHNNEHSPLVHASAFIADE